MTERLRYVVHKGEGPPLLMLHGVLSSNAQWSPNIEALSRVSTPVTVELWGHGDSGLVAAALVAASSGPVAAAL